jgi:hypothetical protein
MSQFELPSTSSLKIKYKITIFFKWIKFKDPVFDSKTQVPNPLDLEVM